MTEAELQIACIDLAHAYGWRVAHFRPARTKLGGWKTPVSGDGKGFPDFLLVRNRVIAAELKATGGRLTPDQVEWLQAFRLANVAAYVWTPKEWNDGTILGVLSAR